MLNDDDWICVWKYLQFFSIMPNVSSTMRTTCNSSIIWLQASKRTSERKKFKSIPRQNRAKVDDVNAINITVDAYICTIPVHVVQHTNSVYKHIWRRPMVIHSRGENPWKFHSISIRASTWIVCIQAHTLTRTDTFMLYALSYSCVVYQCDSALHKIYIKGKIGYTCTTHLYTYVCVHTYEEWQPHGNIYKWNDKHAETPLKNIRSVKFKSIRFPFLCSTIKSQ